MEEIENVKEDVLLGLGATKELLKGAEKVADMVSLTLGPKGRAVAILKETGKYKVTKDGVSVSKSVFPKGSIYESIGAQILKDVAIRTNDIVGDGTTTSTVLAINIIRAGVAEIERGANMVDIVEGIRDILPDIIKGIEDATTDGKDLKVIEKIALISSNNDKEIAKLITKAIKSVGYDGVINFEKSGNEETYIKILNGPQIDRGYLDKAFITDSSKREITFEHPLIMLLDKKISEPSELFPHLEYAAKHKRPVLFIVDEVEQKVIDNLMLNNKSGVQNTIIKAPGFDNSRYDEMSDLAVMLGCEYLKKEDSVEVITLDDRYYGSAEKVTITANTTSFEKPQGDKKKISTVIAKLKKAKVTAKNKTISDRYDERISNFNGRVDLYIGGFTEAEKKERYDRVEDAVNAVSNAINDGVVTGGGYTLFKIANRLKIEGINDKATGERIVLNAIKEPMFKIADNAGKSRQFIEEMCNFQNKGYDARNNKFSNLKDVLDPAKVTKTAVESAISIASLFLLTNGVTIE